MGLVSQKWPLPSNPQLHEPIPQDLVKAWEGQLNNPSTSDCKFNVQGKIIYANSAILSARSKYFELIFKGKWSESDSMKQEDHQTDVEENRNSSQKFNHVIEVTDFHYQTFLEMLRFLYTNKVTFVEDDDEQNSKLTPLDLFQVADKYLVDDLRQHAKLEILKNLNVDDAAEFLFSTAWKYPELKEEVMKYTVLNFIAIRQTPAFKNILANPSNYPSYNELLNELLAELFPATENTWILW
ncbi:10614_t:CDS:2 [Acaulospora colombiana]|uniref:10614_t:CDS:1 n=1 Tax=Acaulospora colombiana TaxID=27376 RepID=A0ACA9LRF0_9GLOM|nr:10614_t:CDS:2 [Acaulospora colombiana]